MIIFSKSGENTRFQLLTSETPKSSVSEKRPRNENERKPPSAKDLIHRIKLRETTNAADGRQVIAVDWTTSNDGPPPRIQNPSEFGHRITHQVPDSQKPSEKKVPRLPQKF